MFLYRLDRCFQRIYRNNVLIYNIFCNLKQRVIYHCIQKLCLYFQRLYRDALKIYATCYMTNITHWQFKNVSFCKLEKIWAAINFQIKDHLHHCPYQRFYRRGQEGREQGTPYAHNGWHGSHGVQRREYSMLFSNFFATIVFEKSVQVAFVGCILPKGRTECCVLDCSTCVSSQCDTKWKKIVNKLRRRWSSQMVLLPGPIAPLFSSLPFSSLPFPRLFLPPKLSILISPLGWPCGC